MLQDVCFNINGSQALHRMQCIKSQLLVHKSIIAHNITVTTSLTTLWTWNFTLSAFQKITLIQRGLWNKKSSIWKKTIFLRVLSIAAKTCKLIWNVNGSTDDLSAAEWEKAGMCIADFMHGSAAEINAWQRASPSAWARRGLSAHSSATCWNRIPTI